MEAARALWQKHGTLPWSWLGLCNWRGFCNMPAASLQARSDDQRSQEAFVYRGGLLSGRGNEDFVRVSEMHYAGVRPC